MQIDVVLFDGCDELDALGPYEVLSNAARDGAPWTVSLAGAHGHAAVTCAHGAVIAPHRALGDPPPPDLVVVPGGGWNERSGPGTWAEAQSGHLPAAIVEHHAAGATIAAVCTGAMLLAHGGLLAGRPATTHQTAVDRLPDHGAHVVDARVVDDGEILTAGGVTSGIDLALWIVERELGPLAADTVARELEHERRGHIVAPQVG